MFAHINIIIYYYYYSQAVKNVFHTSNWSKTRPKPRPNEVKPFL